LRSSWEPTSSCVSPTESPPLFVFPPPRRSAPEVSGFLFSTPQHLHPRLFLGAELFPSPPSFPPFFARHDNWTIWLPPVDLPRFYGREAFLFLVSLLEFFLNVFPVSEPAQFSSVPWLIFLNFSYFFGSKHGTPTATGGEHMKPQRSSVSDRFLNAFAGATLRSFPRGRDPSPRTSTTLVTPVFPTLPLTLKATPRRSPTLSVFLSYKQTSFTATRPLLSSNFLATLPYSSTRAPNPHGTRHTHKPASLVICS